MKNPALSRKGNVGSMSIKESAETDETDYLLSTEANRQHLTEAVELLKNSDNYIYVDPAKL
ncbi:hypothetical protein AFK68_27835 [Hydrocoleum sp. CS-953]|nr:hypothetical protein AFK68_27835 [Hydrocoleum sp. CS-953]